MKSLMLKIIGSGVNVSQNPSLNPLTSLPLKLKEELDAAELFLIVPAQLNLFVRFYFYFHYAIQIFFSLFNVFRYVIFKLHTAYLHN